MTETILGEELMELQKLIEELDFDINDLDDTEVLCACSACCLWQIRD